MQRKSAGGRGPAEKVKIMFRKTSYWMRSAVRMTSDGDFARYSLAGLGPILILVFCIFLFPNAVSRVSAVAFFTALFISSAFILVALTWFAMARSTTEELCGWARFQHEPRSALERFKLVIHGKRIFGGRTGFFTLISYSLLGLSGTLFLIPAVRGELIGLSLSSVYILSVLGVLVTWTLLHTAFALHYVYLYHDPNRQGGLDFPGNDDPTATEFAYFAFTIATSFAASDVSVTARWMRKPVMIHCILAFFYNTAVFALVVNIVLSSL